MTKLYLLHSLIEVLSVFAALPYTTAAARTLFNSVDRHAAHIAKVANSMTSALLDSFGLLALYLGICGIILPLRLFGAWQSFSLFGLVPLPVDLLFPLGVTLWFLVGLSARILLIESEPDDLPRQEPRVG